MKVIRVEGDVAYVELTKGQWATIDAVDVSKVQDDTWHVVPNPMGGWYARSSKGKYMHRQLMDAPRDKQVDHINHDTLDNRRKTNLRVLTGQQNAENRKGAYKGSKTGIRGVSTHKCKPSGLMYVARVAVNGKPKCKYFPHTPEGLELAARAVEEMRRELMPHSTN